MATDKKKSSDDTKKDDKQSTGLKLPTPIVLGADNLDEKEEIKAEEKEDKDEKKKTDEKDEKKKADNNDDNIIKPITISAASDDDAGDDTSDDKDEEDKDEEDDEDVDDALPMPIAFGEDEEDEKDDKLTELPSPVQIGKSGDIAPVKTEEKEKDEEEDDDELHTLPRPIALGDDSIAEDSVKEGGKAEDDSADEEIKVSPSVLRAESVSAPDLPVIGDGPKITAAPKIDDNPSIAEEDSDDEIEIKPLSASSLDLSVPEVKPIAPASVDILKDEELGDDVPNVKETPAEVTTLSGDAEEDHVIPKLGGAVAADAIPLPSTPPAKSGLPLAKIGTGAALIFLGGSIVVGGYFASSALFGNRNAETIPQQALSETRPVTNPSPATPSPAASDSAIAKEVAEVLEDDVPEVDLADLKVKILNGSGVKGAAAKATGLMEDLGFEDVSVGNADSFDYDKTEVQLKADYADLYDSIEEALSESYVVKEGDEVDEDDKFDVYVILGADEPKKTSKTDSDDESL